MKKLIVTLVAAVLCSWGFAQTETQRVSDGLVVNPATPTTTTQATPTTKTKWLPTFKQVLVDGPMKIHFVRIPKAEGPHIVYDTKGCTTSKFTFLMDKNGVLNITERFDSKRITVTDVTIYYHVLENINIARAEVSFDQPVNTPVIDVAFSEGAIADVQFDVRDLKMDVTGKCRIVLSGSARYFDVAISTGKLEAGRMVSMSVDVNASHGAQVCVNATERLHAVTSSSGKVVYKGEPEIIREHTSVFGGHISQMQ